VLRSIILPAYNEAAYIAEMIRRTIAAGERRPDPFEVIVVDNASRDETATIVAAIAGRDDRVRLVRHPENRLYAGSCLSGTRAALGERIFILDADGQHSPDDIWRFDDRLAAGANLVFGWRRKRHEPAIRIAMSRALLVLARLYLGFPLHDVNCGIRAFDRAFADALVIAHRANLVNPELYVRARLGSFVVGEVEVDQAARQAGTSSHEFRRAIRIFADVNRYLLDLRHELARSRR
jgi:glycosyltransferase involved in cell wall biosynthesis